MTAARVTVCVGGGGVGKTTTAAALALSLARGGARTLVVTVDPARRLADALGVDVGQATVAALVCPMAEGRLFAKMPDPRGGMDDLMTWLFEDPLQRRRVQENPAYHELGNSLAGMHELLTLVLLQQEVRSGHFDEIVLDTAPSRNALAFLTYPSRFLELLEAKALTWLSALATTLQASETGQRSETGLFAWGRSKVGGLFGRVVGLGALQHLSLLFAELVSVRVRWATLVRETQQLLSHPSTRYLLIGAPSGAAVADVAYLGAALHRQKLRIAAIVLNRAERSVSDAEQGVLALLDAQPGLVPIADETALRVTLGALATEHRARAAAAEEAEASLRAQAPPGTPVLRLPFVGPATPQAVVLALADAWANVGDSLSGM